MSLVPERYRPYLAGLFGTLVTGFGHLYLRRWLRGLGWIALAFAVTVAFVPIDQTPSLQTLLSGQQSMESAVYPALVQLIAAFDAFLLAYRERTAGEAAEAVVADPESETVACPVCGKEVDPELGFCHWCTTEFAVTESEGAN